MPAVLQPSELGFGEFDLAARGGAGEPVAAGELTIPLIPAGCSAASPPPAKAWTLTLGDIELF